MAKRETSDVELLLQSVEKMKKVEGSHVNFSEKDWEPYPKLKHMAGLLVSWRSGKGKKEREKRNDNDANR